MGAAERLQRVEDYTRLLEGFVLPLLNRELGPKAVAELRAAGEAGAVPIPLAGSSKRRSASR